MSTEAEPTMWAVAGCLFEVSLQLERSGRWRWANPGPEVTLLDDRLRQEDQRFRFRAEAAGAARGLVDLRFQPTEPGRPPCALTVRVAPEHLPAP